MGGFQGDVLTKTPSLYQVPKLRNTTTTTTPATTATTTTTTTTATTTTITTTTATTWGYGGIPGEVLAKTPDLYQVPKLRNWISKNIHGFVDGQKDNKSVTQSDVS